MLGLSSSDWKGRIPVLWFLQFWYFAVSFFSITHFPGWHPGAQKIGWGVSGRHYVHAENRTGIRACKCKTSGNVSPLTIWRRADANQFPVRRLGNINWDSQGCQTTQTPGTVIASQCQEPSSKPAGMLGWPWLAALLNSNVLHELPWCSIQPRYSA